MMNFRGSNVPPKRYIVEQTFGWFGRYWQLTEDREQKGQTSLGWHTPSTFATWFFKKLRRVH
jgi:hypothetical protein